MLNEVQRHDLVVASDALQRLRTAQGQHKLRERELALLTGRNWKYNDLRDELTRRVVIEHGFGWHRSPAYYVAAYAYRATEPTDPARTGPARRSRAADTRGKGAGPKGCVGRADHEADRALQRIARDRRSGGGGVMPSPLDPRTIRRALGVLSACRRGAGGPGRATDRAAGRGRAGS